MVIIGIDTGYGYTKTKNTSFPSSVSMLTGRPPMMTRVLELDGKYYHVGGSAEGIVDNKTSTIDYYILTLAAIAEELKIAGVSEENVTLAVGVPLMRYAEEKAPLLNYLTKRNIVSFKYEDKAYTICISSNGYVFPQGYAAIAPKLSYIKGPCYVIDIGTGTTEILPINSDKSVDLGRAKTVQFGINNCISAINAELSNKFNDTIMYDSIIQILRGNNEDAGLPAAVINICHDVIAGFINDIIKMLRQNKVNYELQQTFFVGGGAGVMKRYSNIKSESVTFIDDICINAKGYEALAKNLISA